LWMQKVPLNIDTNEHFLDIDSDYS
jgi:hypothetical protein